jgi:hypothetical protein
MVDMELVHFNLNAQQSQFRAAFAANSDSDAVVPYIDIRTTHAYESDQSIGRFIEHTRHTPIEALPWLRGVIIAAPQPSDALAVKLAAHGIVLAEASLEEPIVEIVAQLERQFEHIQGAATGWSSTWSNPSGQNPSAPGTPPGSQGADSPYAQKPAYYNQALYEQWLTRLSEPWREEDAWKSEY